MIFIKSIITFQSDDGQKNLVPLGINSIDGYLIKQPEINQAIFISERVELIYNINIFYDYFLLKKFLKFLFLLNHKGKECDHS